MVLFSIVFGANGGYFVSPVCGAALVLLTYALGVRLSGPIVGAIAALCVACSPTVLFLTLSTMSDIPVAAFWAASVLIAARRTTPAAFGSAVAAGIAIVIRPNLVFAAIIPLLIAAWPFPDRSVAAALRRAVTFGLACAPFALFIAWLFNDLYGSPLRSGYGANEELFKLEHVRPNLGLYPRWLWETQGPLVFLFLLGPFVAARRSIRSPLRWLFAAFVAVIVVPYLLYYSFDAWWYLRFLLPAFPFVFILAADAIWNGTERLGQDRRNLATALFTLVMLFFGASYTWQRDVLSAGRGEEKYADVGRYLDQVLPKNAVVYSLQHSGSIRHYTRRLTLRYDLLERNWLDGSIEYMEQIGYEPFIVLDYWEVPRFAERFASQKYVAIVAEEPRAAPCTHSTFFYRVRERPGSPSAVRIPNPRDCY
jgi:4-amino-4-deoxy-L-arabinose transferase-like glycosyltransferase